MQVNRSGINRGSRGALSRFSLAELCCISALKVDPRDSQAVPAAAALEIRADAVLPLDTRDVLIRDRKPRQATTRAVTCTSGRRQQQQKAAGLTRTKRRMGEGLLRWSFMSVFLAAVATMVSGQEAVEPMKILVPLYAHPTSEPPIFTLS